MKLNRIVFSVFALSGLFLAGCTSTKVTQVDSQAKNAVALTDKKWRLTELNGKAIAEKVNGKTPFIRFNAADSTYSASGGCNGLGGAFNLKDNGELIFSKGFSTMMACMDMEVETGINGMMDKVKSFTIDGDKMTLVDSKKAPLARFTLVEESKELEGVWEVDYISGPRIAFEGLYPNKRPQIKFNLTEMRVSGNSSCNNFNGQVKIEGSSISFGPMASTKMHCEGIGESTFFKTLESVDKYSINDNTLTFIMGDIAVMRLQRK